MDRSGSIGPVREVLGYELLFAARERVLLVRFGKSLTERAITSMREAARQFVAVHGPCRGIVDFSAVEAVDVSAPFIATLGRTQANIVGQKRVIVSPRSDVFGLSRMFELHQETAAGDPPHVVRTIEAAYAELGLVDPPFAPVDQR